MTAPTSGHFTANTASNYERYFVPTIPAPLADAALAKASLRPGQTVLDVACGTGIVARLAAERLGPGADIIGVDISPDMLAEAEALSTAAGVRIDWRHGDATRLPVDDDSVDVAFCQLSLQFIEDKAGAALELHRVVKPGGRVVTNVPGTIHPINEAFADGLARHVGPPIGGFMRAVFSMHDPSESSGLLADAGFSDVTATVETHRIDLGRPEEYLWGYASATPLGLALVDVPVEARQALETELVERWRPYTSNGRLTYDQPIVWATGTATER